MEVLREVNCSVMKGCGPEWTDKTVTVFLDDIDSDMSDSEIDYMVRYDVKSQLEKAGFSRHVIREINNA